MGPHPDEDGELYFNLPMGDKKLPGMAAEDIGRCAYGVFKDSKVIDQTIGIAGKHLTGTEMAATLSAAFDLELS